MALHYLQMIAREGEGPLVGLTYDQLNGVKEALYDSLDLAELDLPPGCEAIKQRILSLARQMQIQAPSPAADVGYAREHGEDVAPAILEDTDYLLTLNYFNCAVYLAIALAIIDDGLCGTVPPPDPVVTAPLVEEPTPVIPTVEDVVAPVQSPVIPGAIHSSGSRAGLSTGYKIGIVGGVLAAATALWLVLRRK